MINCVKTTMIILSEIQFKEQYNNIKYFYTSYSNKTLPKQVKRMVKNETLSSLGYTVSVFSKLSSDKKNVLRCVSAVGL